MNSQKLFAAVYIDHDLPEFPNARTSQQQQQQQQQQKQQPPQQQQSHPQQAPPAVAPPVPRGPVPPLTSQKYAQYIQQNMARAAQLQQQVQGNPGVGGLAAQQQANALGFMPGLPGAGVGAFNPGGGAIQPTFPGNPEMTAQFQALRQQQQQHQQQRFGGGQQPPPGFLNMGGSNGSAGAGSSGAAMTLDLLNSLLGAK